MGFPVPKDVRAPRPFSIILGQDEQIRDSVPLADPTVGVEVGEWMKISQGSPGPQAAKLISADTLAAPPRGARVCWTLFVPGDSFDGQSDALATNTADLLSGTYQAQTMLYNTASTFLQPGNLLVAVYDATHGGILDAPDPASYSALHLAAAVGRVISVDAGVLTFESPA